jgi:succinate dehydrogenase / fumarate reductase cytochrome b subunit
VSAATASALRAELRARRVLSFTGVAPLGAYFLAHLASTATSLGGAARFERIFLSSRAMQIFLAAAVLGPLAFHAVYGAILSVRKVRLPAATWMPRLRRVAALTTLAFLAWHLMATRERPVSLYDVLTAELSSTTFGVPLRALAYLVGIAATSFHFATALWTFCTTWFVTWFIGASDRARSRRTRAAWAFGALGVLAFLVGANTVVFLATGSRIVGPRASGALALPDFPAGTHAPCPQPQTDPK